MIWLALLAPYIYVTNITNFGRRVMSLKVCYVLYIQGIPKKRSRYKKVHSFSNNTDISKIFYTVVVLL